MTQLKLPWRLRKWLDRRALQLAGFSSPLGVIRLRNCASQASLVAVGDIALSESIVQEFLKNGTSGVFGDVFPLMSDADFRVGNLETVLTQQTLPIHAEIAGTGTMKASPEAVTVLKEAGFDILTVANNHCRDYRMAGLTECLANLDRAGIGHCGGGPTPSEARKPAIAIVRGVRVGVLGYCDNFRVDCESAENVTPVPPNDDVVLADIAALREEADLIILQLHWGFEFVLYPLKTYRDRARRFAASGADLVLCHHAHVPMGLEVWGNSVIAHGMGNFLFPNNAYVREGHPWTRRSFILRAEFDRNGITAVSAIPCQNTEGSAVRLSRGQARRETLGALHRISVDLKNDTKLRRVERERILREALSIFSRVRDAEDLRVVEQCAMLLRSPCHRDLLARLESEFGAPGAMFEEFLAEVRAAYGRPEIASQAIKTAQSEQFGRIVERLQAVQPLGHSPLGTLP